MTVIAVAPNPFSSEDFPTAMQYRVGNFIYFFVLLAGGTLAYHWKTILAMGTWTTLLWIAGIIFALLMPNAQPELSQAASNAFGSSDRLLAALDPNAMDYGGRIQQ